MFHSYHPFLRKGLFSTTRAVLLASAAVTALAPVAHAQFRASITGTVTDSTGAVIPGAQVTLVDKQTGKSLQSTTNGAGTYNFNALPPDTFTLTTAMSGFSTKTINDLSITPEQANNVNVQLAISASSTVVEVNADTVSPLETTTGSISGTISSNEIQHLPTAGGDVLQLLQLTPGAFGDGQRSSNGGTNSLPGSQGPGGSGAGQGSFSTENGPQVLSNGGQYETNAISINGISTTSAVWGGTSIITPNRDSVDAVKITSNGYDAEFGRFSGANVEITTKAGTNSFHGSAFFRVDRPGLNAFNRYNGPNSLLPFTLGPGVANTNVNRAAAHGLVRDTTRDNDIGGSVGGPILKDRIFAFFAYETIRSGSNTTANHWYETPQFDTAAANSTIANKYTNFANHGLVGATQLNSTCATAGLTEGVNCRTVSGGIDIGSPLKTARGTQDPTYISNSNPGTGSGLDGVPDIALYQTSTPDTQTSTQYNGRLDGDATHKDHLSFTIYWVPLTHNYINGPARGYNQWHHNQVNEAVTLVWNHTFSSSFLNEARANASGWRWNEVTDNPQAPFGLPQDSINTPGGTGTDVQYFGASGPSHLNQWTYGYKDVATKIIGNHSIRFGGDATQLHYLQDPVYAARPSFNFYNVWNFLNDAPYNESGQFNRFTGVPFSNRYDMREWITGGFVQDDWKASRNLTLNMGVRYNYFDSLYSKQNNLSHVVLGSGAATYTGLQLVRGGNSWVPQKGNVGPQFGFAYNPDMFNRRFVVRGGYGLSYNQEEIAISANQSNSPNDSVSPTFNNSTPTAADSRIQYNIPADSGSLFGYAANTNTITAYGANGLPTTSGFQLTIVPNHLKTQQVNHYSLQVEGDLGHQMVATAIYQGSSAHHLIFHQNAYTRGQYLGQAFNTKSSLIDIYGDNGGSNFNSLVLDLKHNYAHNFSVDASYTWAKSMDDNSGPYTEDPYSYRPDLVRGRSDFNVGQAFKIYGLYAPKFYYGANNFAKVLLNGFNISGIFNLHSGFPWTPTANYGVNAFYTGSGYGTLRPTGYFGNAGHDYSNASFMSANSPSRNFQGGPQNYFSVYDQTTIANSSSAFPNPIRFFPLPGLARNSFTGPRYRDLDATVTKAFGIPNRYLGERTGLEFRVDAFNVLNITNLSSNINSQVQTVTNGAVSTNPNFGISTAGLAGRQVQMQARISF